MNQDYFTLSPFRHFLSDTKIIDGIEYYWKAESRPVSLKEKTKVTAKEKRWELCDHEVYTSQQCDKAGKQRNQHKWTKTTAILGLCALDQSGRCLCKYEIFDVP